MVDLMDRRGVKTDLRPWAREAMSRVLAEQHDERRAIGALATALSERARAMDDVYAATKFAALGHQPVETPKPSRAEAERLFRKRRRR